MEINGVSRLQYLLPLLFVEFVKLLILSMTYAYVSLMFEVIFYVPILFVIKMSVIQFVSIHLQTYFYQ